MDDLGSVELDVMDGEDIDPVASPHSPEIGHVVGVKSFVIAPSVINEA